MIIDFIYGANGSVEYLWGDHSYWEKEDDYQPALHSLNSLSLSWEINYNISFEWLPVLLLLTIRILCYI